MGVFTGFLWELFFPWSISFRKLPYDVENPKDELNPVGTALIEVNVNTHQLINVIIEMDTSYANNGINFSSMDKNDIIKWMEQETGLIYGQQLQLHKEEEGRLECQH